MKKIPSMKVNEITHVTASDAKKKVVGIRPGEKLHEQMIGAKDSCFTYEHSEHFTTLLHINGSADDERGLRMACRL
jgi:UDP-N-acetylglucosamine 4,6-dehydratase/5-epimerase